MSSSTALPHSQSPPSPLSLPKEILGAIITHFDKSSAIAFGRVFPSLSSLLDPIIWEHIDVSLNPHYGRLVLVEPNDHAAGSGPRERAISAAKVVEVAHRRAIREKVRTIIRRANEQRCDYVKSVRLVVRPGAVNGMVQMLDLLPNLQRLEIQAPPPREYEEHWPAAEDAKTLDFRLLGGELDLNALTHLHIGLGAIRYIGAIPYFCSLAPNLISLDLFVARFSHTQKEDIPDFPRCGNNSIQNLCLRCVSRTDEDDEDDELLSVSLEVFIDKMVKLRSISLDYDWADDGDDGDSARRFIAAFASKEELRELDWSTMPIGVFETMLDADPGFAGLQRLTLDAHGWYCDGTDIPRIPSLEQIYFVRTTRVPPQTTSPLHASIPFPSELAAILRDVPLLRTIHTFPCEIRRPELVMFTEIEAIGDTVNGEVNSVRHGDKELLFARFRPEGYEGVTAGGEDHRTIEEVTGIGKLWAEPGWQYVSDYEGVAVPLEIIEKMRVKDGVSVKEWRGRGLEVGDEAWQVLTEWYASIQTVNW